MGENFDIDPEFAKVIRPGVAVDTILFAVLENDLKVGLIQRHEDPYNGSYAMPGRFVRYDEKIEDTALRALEQKCNIDPSSVFLEQLYTFGQNLERDTRIRTITIVYYGILSADDVAEHRDAKISWFSAYDLPKLAFDHKNIVEYAVERLRNRILWDTYAFKFLPPEFTLTELQHVYEIILHKELDKRNFRKKILEEKFLVKTAKTKIDGVHRPAALYKFKSKKQKF